MANDETSDAEKEHEPSTKRLEDARKQGDVAKSNDLTTAASYLGFILAFSAGGSLILSAATYLSTMLEPVAKLHGGTGAENALIGSGLTVHVLLPLGALFLLPVVAAIGSLFAQNALVIAPTKIRPKLSRISPLSTARQKFGPEGLVEFLKNSTKLVLVGGMLSIFLMSNLNDILATASLEPSLGMFFLFSTLGKFLTLATIATALIGGVDFLWQVRTLRQRNRMTRKEMLDEHKDSEGDPHTKSERRQRGQELAMNQMLAEIGSASVVIVNPTHYAVALRWKRNDPSAPVVIAKGVDEIALKIRAEATRCGVPIHSDPPTARAIHASIRLGQPIRREHYKAVAAAIRFADLMRKKTRKQQ